jgi:hypothetical protein
VRASWTDWFKAGIARQGIGPSPLGIAPHACTILNKLLLLLLSERSLSAPRPPCPGLGLDLRERFHQGAFNRHFSLERRAPTWFAPPLPASPGSASLAVSTRESSLILLVQV